MTYTPPHNPRDGGLPGAALRTLTSAPREVWIALAALLAFNVSLRFVAGRLGIVVDEVSLKPGYIAYEVIGALAVSAGVGLVLHSLLTGQPLVRPGRGFLGFVAFTAGVSLYSSVMAALSFGAAASGTEGLALRFVIVAVGMIGGIIVFIRLMLLPISWLAGDPGMTPAVSWTRMRGQVLTYIGASIILSLPTTLLVLLVAGATGAAQGVAPSLPVMIVQEALVLTYAAITASLDAVMYRRRAGDPQTRLGEVFE